MSELGERAEALAEQVIQPLLVGGKLSPLRPFGARLALTLGEGRRIVDNDLRTRVDNARLRVARTIVAVDLVPELDVHEWALAAMFNDLLQATNHELSSWATRGRHDALAQAVAAACDRLPPCRDLAAAVARHATFSRALEVARVDTRVSWWTGSETFRGQEAPTRLLAWPGLRRVGVQRTTVTLAAMAPGSFVSAGAYVHALGRWISASPLSDLASAARSSPPFAWSSSTVSLVSVVAGANLALRAIRHHARDGRALRAASHALETAAAALAPGAQNVALAFVRQLQAGAEQWASSEDA
jgi:hypothetical protein